MAFGSRVVVRRTPPGGSGGVTYQYDNPVDAHAVLTNWYHKGETWDVLVKPDWYDPWYNQLLHGANLATGWNPPVSINWAVGSGDVIVGKPYAPAKPYWELTWDQLKMPALQKDLATTWQAQHDETDEPLPAAVLHGEVELAMGWLLAAFGWRNVVSHGLAGWQGTPPWQAPAIPVPLPEHWWNVAKQVTWYTSAPCTRKWVYDPKYVYEVRIGTAVRHDAEPGAAILVALADYLLALPEDTRDAAITFARKQLNH